MKSKRIALAGIFGCLSFLLTFIEFPIFPVLPFLKFDASDSIVIYITLLFGYAQGFLTLLVKSFLFLFKTGDGGLIGLLMNLIAGTIFITSMYYLKKRLNLILTFILSSFFVGVSMCIVNYYISIPIYTNQQSKQFINNLGLELSTFFLLVIAFNMIKFIADSIIAYIISKKTKKIIKNI